MKYIPIVFLLFSLFVVQLSHASYLVTTINTTVSLNTNTSAQVVEILRVSVNNNSVSQYSTDRLALNLTLSQWQTLMGPSLVQHIVNPRGSIYNFDFLPGPLINSANGKIAYLVMSYSVTNVTTINQTGPRTFLYQFNPANFNYQNAVSGQVLGQNTTLHIILPTGARIDRISPPPDVPVAGFEQNYRNVTSLTWSSDESLSAFTLTYTVQESLQDEVLSFFDSLYARLGTFAFVIIILAIALFIIYTYLKARK
ncbi:MAG: hypothetical protein ACHQX1_00045 [Candidatus Micrarchaeales archaeon]